MIVEELPPAVAAAGGAFVNAPQPLLHAEVADYALAHGLIAPAQIAAGDLVIRNLSSRNRVYAVESSDSPSWLIKQGIGGPGMAMIANEARAYATLDALGPAVQRHLPAWRGYDAERGVCVLGLLTDARSMRVVQQRTRRAPVGVARELGRALAAVHRATMREDGSPLADPGWMPAGLLLHRPSVELLHEGSAAAIELVKIIQRTPGFFDHLEALRRLWQPRAFVHLDVKWDNCLVWGSRGRRLALIDWESACVGDPCWDIGSALGHYLSAWVFSVPITGQTPPERFAELADRPLGGLQPAIRSCWEAYREALGPAVEHEHTWLFAAVRFAAARLVLTAFETAQVSAQLTAPLMLHLQLALNMLERPHEAAVHLLGLSLDRTVSA